MMKRVMIVGVVTVLALGVFAMAQMQSGEKMAEDSASTQAEGQGLTLEDFLVGIDNRAEEDREADDGFFRLDPGPEVDVSSVEPVPSAANNQPYRSCTKTPEMQANIGSPGSDGNRAYRDIAGYLSTVNVIATRDCTCAGKIVPHEAVAAFEGKLREQFGIEVLEPKHTRDLYNEYQHQKKIVAAMCGEF